MYIPAFQLSQETKYYCSVTCNGWDVLGPGPNVENDGHLDPGDHEVSALPHHGFLDSRQPEHGGLS